ncbi:MAG TPA: hypothetical protein DCO72_03005 [Ruminococcus sp.]|nr:hypothetical protein [Ruminococcus sp.]
MKELIQSYRASQASLRDRIHELNAIMQNKRLETKEKENLLARRALLYSEIYDMDEWIHQMESILKGA